jgi:predicted ester cyclase
MNIAEDVPTSVRVIERMLHEGFATGGTDVVDELCAPDMVEHQFGLVGTGQEAIAKVKRGITDVFRAMPDIQFTISDWAEHGDTAWVRAEATGTQTGPFIGAASGRSVRFTVIDVARVVNGRIVEHWGVPDRFAILAQTGQLPRPVERV